MGKYAAKAPPGRRWGALREYNHAIRIGSKSWQAMPYRLRQLTAWRGTHLFGGHPPVRRYARKYGVKPSSNITLATKVRFFEDHLARKAKKEKGKK